MWQQPLSRVKHQLREINEIKKAAQHLQHHKVYTVKAQDSSIIVKFPNCRLIDISIVITNFLDL